MSAPESSASKNLLFTHDDRAWMLNQTWSPDPVITQSLLKALEQFGVQMATPRRTVSEAIVDLRATVTGFDRDLPMDPVTRVAEQVERGDALAEELAHVLERVWAPRTDFTKHGAISVAYEHQTGCFLTRVEISRRSSYGGYSANVEHRETGRLPLVLVRESAARTDQRQFDRLIRTVVMDLADGPLKYRYLLRAT